MASQQSEHMGMPVTAMMAKTWPQRRVPSWIFVAVLFVGCVQVDAAALADIVCRGPWARESWESFGWPPEWGETERDQQRDRTRFPPTLQFRLRGGGNVLVGLTTKGSLGHQARSGKTERADGSFDVLFLGSGVSTGVPKIGNSRGNS